MNRSQSIRYNQAKQEFKDQMDPTDLDRSFYVDPSGTVLGFLIIRSNGKMLAYDAAENQYSYSSENEITSFDVSPESSLLDLPPYEYHLNRVGERELIETHAFPDPSTNSVYETLRLLRMSTGENQFRIALTMTDLLPSKLTGSELFLMANKAVLLYQTNLHSLSLKEITETINSLILNDLAGDKIFNHLSSLTTKNILLAADQDSFNLIITYLAEEKKMNAFPFSIRTRIPTALLIAKLQSLVSHTEQPHQKTTSEWKGRGSL